MKLMSWKIPGLALVCAVLLATPAFATTILVMDETRIVSQSAAGKSVLAQLKSIGEQINTELSNERKAIGAERDRIAAQSQTLSQDQLKQRVEALGKRATSFEQLMRRRAAEMEATKKKAMGTINQHLQPVLQQITTAKGADILVDRSQLVFAKPGIDISAEVITKLDAKLKPFRVQRVSQ